MSRPGKYLALAVPALFLTLLLTNPQALTQESRRAPGAQSRAANGVAPSRRSGETPRESLLTLRLASSAGLEASLDLPVAPMPASYRPVSGGTRTDAAARPTEGRAGAAATRSASSTGGARSAGRAGAASAGVRQRRYVVLRMLVTAYCPCRKCCGRFSDGKTASGKSIYANSSMFVAADTSLLPFGTEISVPGYYAGRPVPVEDRGGRIKGNRLDVFFLSHHQARQWGARWMDVKVYLD